MIGVSSCCYWIEEPTQAFGAVSEPATVLFDEDRFFEIKHSRTESDFKPLFSFSEATESQHDLALRLDDFSLIIQSFLRCQSMSSYISSRPKQDMVYY